MANTSQRSFASGELAPALWARTDLVKYATGLRTCRNLITLRQGGVSNRAGTELVGLGLGVTRLLPFVFNDSQTYALEFSNLVLRFVRSGAYIGGGVPYTVATPYLASELFDLRIAQSADVVTIVHPNHPPMNLSRIADNNWTLGVISFVPGIAAPANVRLVPSDNSIIGGGGIQWVVTAIDATTGQESLVGTSIGINLAGLNELRTVNWDAVPNASAYNVYKGTFPAGSLVPDLGFIGSTGTLAFFDNNFTPDLLNRAPVDRQPFVGVGNYPAAVGYYQQRLLFASTLNQPETVWTSRSADFKNFTVSQPSQDDDAITFTLVSGQVNQVQHLVSKGALLILTNGGEWVINGDVSNILRPTDVNALEFSDNGVSRLRPISIDTRLLYVQARQAVVRDIKKDPWSGYLGTDMTVYAAHLFEGHSLVEWSYQKSPMSIVWAVRDDGVLVGLTDVADQQILAWHRHDTDGLVESVCVIPEGTEDRLYLVVNRGGVRMVERMASRFFSDVQDAIFTDATLTYDGRNADQSKTMTLSAGTDWTYDELLTLTCSASEFSAGDIGNAIVLTDADASVIRFTIAGFSSATVVTGFPQKTVPVSLRGIAVTAWSRAVDQVAGLSHLEGKAVSIFADGFVVSSPNNPSVDTITVTAGVATLDRPYSYIHVGLPYTSDLETLDIDTAEGPSTKTKAMLLNQVSAMVDRSRGIFAGSQSPGDDSLTNLVEYKVRQTETYDQPVNLATATIKINILADWASKGRVFLRQVDPLPLTVLSVIPTGYLSPPA